MGGYIAEMPKLLIWLENSYNNNKKREEKRIRRKW
jgi:hypothetical protein